MTFLVDVDGFNGVESEGGVVGGQKDVHSDLEVILVSLTTLQQLLYSPAHTLLLLSSSKMWVHFPRIPGIDMYKKIQGSQGSLV